MKCRFCNKLDLVFDHGPFNSYPPPCDNLLLSHTIPSALEHNDVSRSIGEIAGRLSGLEKTTEQLGSLARELEAAQRRCAEERDILEKALLEYQSVVTPIRMIPDDVLSEIFLAQVVGSPDYVFRGAPAPMVLAGVCRRWRSVCLSSPRIWAHTHIRILKWQATHIERKANLMRMFTNRSGACPMQIALRMDITSDKGWGVRKGAKMMLPLVNEITNSAGRWQALEIDFSRASLRQFERVLHASHSQLFEALETLRIVTKEDMEPLSFFACAPRLKRVNFEGPTVQGLELPWGQIENLTSQVSATPSSMQFLVATLAQCLNLVHGHFHFCNQNAYGDDDDDQVSNQLAPVRVNLRSCIVQVPRRRMFREFFDSLDLPSVTSLHIYSRSYRGVSIWSPSSFSNFLQRSCCTLQRLTLEIERFSKPDLLQVLAFVPSLEELHFYTNIWDPEWLAIDNDVLQQLTSTSMPGSTSFPLLLPNLRTLKIIAHGVFKFDLDVFIAMLQSRTELPLARRLTDLHLYHEWLAVRDAENLKSALAGTGLSIHMQVNVRCEEVSNP